MSTRSISWGGKGSRCVRLTTLPPSCTVVTKSGNLNFLEPSGPVQAWNGTDFTSSSAIQVKNWQSTISITEKLDVISQLKKSERIIDIRCNTIFTRISLRTFRDNVDGSTEGAKSGTKALVCVAWLPQSCRNASYQTLRVWISYIFIAL